MKNLPCAIWTTFFPLVTAIDQHFYWMRHGKEHEIALIMFYFIWSSVAVLLLEKK